MDGFLGKPMDLAELREALLQCHPPPEHEVATHATTREARPHDEQRLRSEP